MTCALPHRMRSGQHDDLGCILDSWLQEMRHAPFSQGIRDDVFFPLHRALVLSLVGSAFTSVACNLEDANHIYGYCVYELAPARLHWIYVKSSYERVGLGSALLYEAFGDRLGQDPIFASHWTRELKLRTGWVERHRIVYSPYLLMKPIERIADARAAEIQA